MIANILSEVKGAFETQLVIILLMMEAVHTSETSVNLYQTTRHHPRRKSSSQFVVERLVYSILFFIKFI
jgi:hypothetical protein